MQKTPWHQRYLISVFLSSNFEKKSTNLKSLPLILSKREVSCNIKYFQVCYQKCLMWVFSGCNFKNCCHAWNKHAQISQIRNFHTRDKKNLKFGTKNSFFNNFWNETSKIFYHIWNQHPQVCRDAEFYSKIKKTSEVCNQNCSIWVCFRLQL